ncbi:SymE family type I addiction module toxin [Otoolea muris]|uniref:SymE family type I addiction module toxin n=1 Tax=Otoolea muris TaxID=2941515 RepID=UPI002040146F|nr:SymE family type I addiction module toxin [Otoolea muris]
METRKLTVYWGSTKAYNPIPKIILQGHWLSDLGFSIGDKVTLSCQQNKVIIERIIEDQEQQEQDVKQEAGRRQRKGNTNGRY